MKGEMTVDTETGKYIEEYQTHAVKAVEHYIEAGKVIVRAKKHLEHGQIETFYEKCGLSRVDSSRLCGIADCESLNVSDRKQLELAGYTISIPEKVDIPMEDLRSVKNPLRKTGQ